MKALFLITVFCSIIFFKIFAQEGTIKVQDNDTKLPIAGVSIKDCNGTNYGATNTQGIFELKHQVSCLIFQRLGYKTDTLSIDILKQRNWVVGLIPVVNELEEVQVSAGYQTIPK